MDGSVPTPVTSTRRRDNRVHAAEGSLPAAQPVQSARASMPASGARRRFVPWLLVSAMALVIVGAITAGVISLGLQDDAVVTASGAGTVSGRDALGTRCVPGALDESSERGDRCTATTTERDETSPHAPDAIAVDDHDADSAEGLPKRPPTSDGTTPDGTTPGAPGPSDPSGETPGRDDPVTPGADTPGAPSAPAPAPAAPAPAPAPVAPAPAPAPAAPAPAPRPLAFAGISENHAIGLLGIRILSSYTLSLSGQPGATASVTYGGSNSGSVTFDSGGRASITLGESLLSAGLGNPTIRVAYSDGTSGSAIQAPRDSI